MRLLLLLLLLGLLTASNPGAAVEVQQVRLDGGAEEYAVPGWRGYVLTCDYRTAYDETLQFVHWDKSGARAYTWPAQGQPTVFTPLLGLVDSAPISAPQNLHIRHVTYDLAGTYTCTVVTSTANASLDYDLYVVDASSGVYTTKVVQLSAVASTNSSLDDAGYQVDEGAEDEAGAWHTEVEFEDPACTLLWSFASPAIFPRPNVTCGYFSVDLDDVVRILPAGLTLHQHQNGSWAASFSKTRVQVSDIPMEHRLGCTVRVPNTTYKKVVKDNENFVVDSLIDVEGCPDLLVPHAQGLKVQVEDATHTCRGEVLPSDRSGSAVAHLSCPAGHYAVLPDGTADGDWTAKLTCSEHDRLWRRLDPAVDQDPLPPLFPLKDLPHCQPGLMSGGRRLSSGSLVALALLPLLLLSCQLH